MTEYFAQTLASVLEETSTNMGNAMILNHLSKNGAVTLEEAEFYHNLCTDVITEAAEDFIPDEIDVPDDQGDVPADQGDVPADQGDVPADQGDDDALPPIELFDAVGNKYVFQDGQLVPVDDDQDATDDVDQDAAADDAAVPDDTTNQGDYQESEVVDEKAPVIEESEGIAEESEILEESSTVVARILANLK